MALDPESARRTTEAESGASDSATDAAPVQNRLAPVAAAKAPRTDVAAELWSWAAGRPRWQQHLIALLLTKDSLSASERADCVDMVVESCGGRPAAAKMLLLARTDFPAPAPAADTPRLITLGPLRYVNAISDGNQIRFEADGLSVVFGKNAAGKSGYVRALKRLCRTVDSDTSILPNVFAKGPVGSPRAQVETRTTTGLVARQYDLAPGTSSPLRSMSVFDARCATVYVTEQNEVAFVPSLLGLLDRLAHEHGEMKALLDERVAAMRAKRQALPNVPSGTSATFLGGLNSRTSEAEVDAACAPLSVEEQDRMNHLALALAPVALDEQARRRSLLEAEAKHAEDLLHRLDHVAAAVGAAVTAELDRLRDAAIAARETARLAGGEAFGERGMRGIGGEPWRRLWEAARAFYEGDVAPGGSFPPTEGECPLCFQELSAEARARLIEFEKFVKTTAEDEAKAAEAAYAEACASIDDDWVRSCRVPVLETLKDLDGDAHAALEGWLVCVGERLSALKTGARERPHLPPCPSGFIRDFAGARRAEAATMDATRDAAASAILRREFDELQARAMLVADRDVIKSYVSNLKDTAVLETAAERLQTRAISVKQRDLSERVVTQALAQRLRGELDELNFPHVAVKVTAKARSGVTYLAVGLEATAEAPDKILSQGEGRALALAFFLAEINEPGHDGGVIFDDPVSSLDHERMDLIAERLAREAQRRQVIIFTHDLSFLVRVRAAAERLDVPIGFQTIWRSGDLVGRTEPDAPFEAMPVKKRVAWLSDQLQNLKEEEFASQASYRQAISGWYEQLRRSWERLVEEVVLGGVVERYSPAVQTQRLKDVRVSDATVTAVERGMERSSKWVHDQPTADNATLPGKQEMARDLAEIRDLLAELRKKT